MRFGPLVRIIDARSRYLAASHARPFGTLVGNSAGSRRVSAADRLPTANSGGVELAILELVTTCVYLGGRYLLLDGTDGLHFIREIHGTN